MTITALPPAPSRSAPSTFSTLADAFLAALATFVTEANATAAAMNLNDTTANSTTSVAIGTGAKSLTVDVSKSFQPGMSVKIARTAAPSNWMHGDVTSYDSGTGALVVAVTSVLGSGTFTDWTITLSGPGVDFASAAEILTGTEAGKAIAPDQLAASFKSVPTGAVFAWATGTVPDGYLECDGSSLDRTTYAALFAAISDDYGNVDGTHFNLPDYRGRFLRGWAHGQTTDPDKATRTDRGDSVTGDYVGTKQADGLKSHLHNIVSGPSAGGVTNNTAGANDSGTDKNTALTGGNETRPININVMFIIKY